MLNVCYKLYYIIGLRVRVYVCEPKGVKFLVQAETMVAGVKQAFKANLPNLSWMDQRTRQLSEEKVQIKRVNYHYVTWPLRMCV